MKKGDIVRCIRDQDDDGLYSMYLIKGLRYQILDIESDYLTIGHRIAGNYVGRYPLYFFLTVKEIRKLKLEKINGKEKTIRL